MELTDKLVDYYCNAPSGLYSDELVKALASALQAERAKPNDSMWKDAPEGTEFVDVCFYRRSKDWVHIGTKTYTRELPKTRAREIAEELAEIKDSGYVRMEVANLIESAILMREKELGVQG